MAKSKQTSAATPEMADGANQTALAERVEQERLTRRQALRKFGFGAGLSAFMLLGVDDLARMVGREIERRAGDSLVAQQIAKDFQSAGIALAAGPSTTNCCQAVDNGYNSCISNASMNYPLPWYAVEREFAIVQCAADKNRELEQYCQIDCTFK